MMDVILYRWYSNAKLFGRKFIYDEDGAVSIVTIVVLIGIAILLAVVFRIHCLVRLTRVVQMQLKTHQRNNKWNTK